MATFLDLWSLIPLVILFFSNLCICGLFFTPSPPDVGPVENSVGGEDDEEVESSGQYETDSIGWNRNIVILSPKREAPPSELSDRNRTPDLVDEENTPIFLNAVAGLFFPICHTEAVTEGSISSESLSTLLSWQNRFFKVHVLVFNVLIMTTVIVVFFLVASAPSFNYNYNVLDYNYFKAGCSFLGLMSVISGITCFESEISSLVSKIYFWREVTPRHNLSEDLWKRTYTFTLVSSLISLPAILGLVLFHANPPPTPLVFVAVERGQNMRELAVLGASVPPGFAYHQSQTLTEGGIINNCSVSPMPENDIVLLNLTDPLCQTLLDDRRESANLRPNMTIVVLDNSEEIGWRVSSPNSKLESLSRSIKIESQVILLRKSEWTRVNKQLVTGQRVTISFNSNFDLEELQMFKCRLKSPLRLALESESDVFKQENGEAILHTDGGISQKMTVPLHCSSYGKVPCKKWGIPDTMTGRTQCSNITETNIQLVTHNGHVMKEAKILLPNNVTRKTCCFNSHTLVSVYSNETETIIESKLLTNAFLTCRFSEVIHGTCNERSGMLEQSRVCVHDNFVLQPYSQVSCYTGEIVKNTCNPQFNCHT